MRVRLRARVNARLPDHDGKFRDEITQEFELELDGSYKGRELKELIEIAEAELNAGLERTFVKITALGGKAYKLPEAEA